MGKLEDSARTIAADIKETIQGLDITQALDRLKRDGRTPTARVRIDPETMAVERVVLSVGAVDYYFHGTKDRNGKRLSVRKRMEVEREGVNVPGIWYDVPFDGWNVRIG